MKIKVWIWQLTILMSTLLFFACHPKFPKVLPAQSPVDHGLWDSLLHLYVTADGWVDYQGLIRDSSRLNNYLDLLASAHPQLSWSREEQMAYWINAYNAFTVKLILDHYPVASIKDIKKGIPFVNTVWDIPFIHIQTETYDLNQIEHGILRRKFKDARIHAAINCASYSCPRLSKEAYAADRLNDQLDDAMRTFLRDERRNHLTGGKAEASSIFKWFGGDFKRDGGSLRKYFNRYLDDPIPNAVPIDFLEYDWSLNDAALLHDR